MTKSRGIGRGGARPNSGPKPKPIAPATKKPVNSKLSAQELAKLHVELAIETLSNIAANGAAEAARVSAAKAIVEIAKGETTHGTLGKKGLVQAEAENAGRGSEWEGDLEFSSGR